MIKLIICVPVLLLTISGLMLSTQHRELKKDTIPGTLASDRIQRPSNEQRDLLALVAWRASDSAMVEAKAERLIRPGNVSSIILTIRNSTTNQVITQKPYEGYLISLYTRDLNGDDTPELIYQWTSGLAGDHIEIFSVVADRAKTILDEFYRTDVAFIKLSQDDNVDVLITSARGGAMPSYTTRYMLKGGQYQPAGSVSFGRLQRIIKGQFTQK